MRILHTADWHLGQTLHGVSRAWEHARFLDWLLDQVERHAADALVVAGDVFDVASPGAAALAQYFGFLADARRRFPRLDLVVVGGNHDAPARLDAARAILDALAVRVVGGLPFRPDGGYDLERLLVPLRGPSGDPGALLVALPFLRPKDLPRSATEARALAGLPSEAEDAATAVAPGDVEAAARARPAPGAELVEGHRALYAALTEAAERRRPTGGALVATGHAYVAGGALSELSERKIQQGNQQALPASLFPEALAYVALGHLHLAQEVGARPMARYSGSPIPLSMAELEYPHQVLLVDLEGPALREVRPARVPRFVELLRVPAEHAPLEEVEPLLAALPREAPPGAAPEARPLLEVRIRLDAPRARLRQSVEAALEGAWPRLVKIDVARPGAEPTAHLPRSSLRELAPEEVFRAAHQRARGAEPSPALLTAFRTLIEEMEAE